MATYWVATDGNNGWDGSEETPWLTIKYGYDQCSPADTLMVKNGDYNERVIIDTDCSDGNEITVRAENTLGANCKQGMRVTGDYNIIQGFEI